jgi:peroxiredoxin
MRMAKRIVEWCRRTNAGRAAVLGLAMLPAMVGWAQGGSPQVGEKAPEFALATPEGKSVRLSELTGRGTVLLVVLRGYPGYQCPFCQKQVHDFVSHAKGFAEKGAEVLFVYPGPGVQLGERAKEFLSQEDSLPGNVHLVLDPDYAFTKQYGLRWDAEAETAYPSTFLIDRKGKVFFAKVVKSHGDRTTAEAMLAELGKAE